MHNERMRVYRIAKLEKVETLQIYYLHFYIGVLMRPHYQI